MGAETEMQGVKLYLGVHIPAMLDATLMLSRHAFPAGVSGIPSLPWKIHYFHS